MPPADPPPPSFAVTADTPSQAEGNGGSGTAFVFTVTRADNTAGTDSIAWTAAGSGPTPVNTADFAGGAVPSGTATFAPGETSHTVTVDIAADAQVEPNEGLQLVLGRPSPGAVIASGGRAANAAVLNDDATISIAPLYAVHAEGNFGTSAFTFRVTRTGDTAATAIVAWAAGADAGSSLHPQDFAGGVLPGGTLTFAPGETVKLLSIDMVAAGVNDATITLEVLGDNWVEPDQQFTVLLQNPALVGTTLGTASILANHASATILNDDAPADTPPARHLATQEPISMSTPPGLASDPLPPSFSVAANTTAQAEGNSGGSTPFVFTITRADNTTGTDSIAWTAAAAGPNGVNGADFAGHVVPAGTLTFAPGETSQTITVEIAGDTQVEPDEGLQVVLGRPSAGAVIATGGRAANATVLADESSISITAADAVHAEGNFGSTPFYFHVTRSAAAGASLAGSATVVWAVGAGTTPGVSPADFAGGVVPSGTISFAPGEAMKILTIDVAGDTSIESDENFRVALSSPSAGARIATGIANGQIINDDALMRIINLPGSGAYPHVVEGTGGTTPFNFTIHRLGLTDSPASVEWSVVGVGRPGYGVAGYTAGPSDFAGGVVPSGTVTFAAGVTDANVSFGIAGDSIWENPESFKIVLSHAVGADSLESTPLLTIEDDDSMIRFAPANITATNEGGQIVLAVFRYGSMTNLATVQWHAYGSGAHAATVGDFVPGQAMSGTLTFAPGQFQQLITLDTLSDPYLEPAETFSVALTNLTGTATSLGVNNTTCMIYNDDGQISITALDADKAEGNTGSNTPFTFLVTADSSGYANNAAFTWSVVGTGANPATATDFARGIASSGSGHLVNGTATITVEVLGDNWVEPDQQFSVLIKPVDTAHITAAVNHATGTIRNDDGLPGALSGSLTNVATADLTGDGTADTLRQAANGDLYLLDGATASMTRLSLPAAGLTFLAAADFSGDGRADILLRGGAGALYDWTMDGVSVHSVDLVTWLAPNQSVAGTADYTGDGHADILLHDSSAGAANPWTLLQPGTQAAPASYATWPLTA